MEAKKKEFLILYTTLQKALSLNIKALKEPERTQNDKSFP
jgi:hypothetical protein